MPILSLNDLRRKFETTWYYYFMQITTLTVGQMGTNCYLVESGEEVGIVDPGDDGEYIIEKIEASGKKPLWVTATHGHFDHVLCVSEVALTYNIPFYISPKDNFLLKQAPGSAEYFTGVKADPLLVEPFPFPEQGTVRVGEERLEIIETPGHTPGGVCFYSRKYKSLIGGDLLFAGGGIGRTDFRYSSVVDLEKSIKKVLKLPENTIVFPGHGEETTVGDLKVQLEGFFR